MYMWVCVWVLISTWWLWQNYLMKGSCFSKERKVGNKDFFEYALLFILIPRYPNVREAIHFRLAFLFYFILLFVVLVTTVISFFRRLCVQSSNKRLWESYTLRIVLCWFCWNYYICQLGYLYTVFYYIQCYTLFIGNCLPCLGNKVRPIT